MQQNIATMSIERSSLLSVSLKMLLFMLNCLQLPADTKCSRAKSQFPENFYQFLPTDILALFSPHSKHVKASGVSFSWWARQYGHLLLQTKGISDSIPLSSHTAHKVHQHFHCDIRQALRHWKIWSIKGINISIEVKHLLWFCHYSCEICWNTLWMNGWLNYCTYTHRATFR